jgi:hypothetical protein
VAKAVVAKIEETGIVPARFILTVASIHSQRAQDLREAGFTVTEPDEDDLEQEPEA